MNIDYRLDGPKEAPMLVLANSLGTTWDMWQPQMAALTRDFNVLRYNPRGHGSTPLPSCELNLEILGRDVIALLDHLDVENASFCGISMGGLTGLWLARHYPARFRKMVVANTAARIGSEEAWLQRARQVREQGLSAVGAGSSARWFTPEFIRHAHPQVSRLVMQLSHGSAVGYAACCDVLAQADLHADAGRINLPLLVVAGEFDTITPLVQAQWLHQHIAKARLEVLPAAHLSNIACPEEFNTSVVNFLHT